MYPCCAQDACNVDIARSFWMVSGHKNFVYISACCKYGKNNYGCVVSINDFFRYLYSRRFSSFCKWRKAHRSHRELILYSHWLYFIYENCGTAFWKPEGDLGDQQLPHVERGIVVRRKGSILIKTEGCPLFRITEKCSHSYLCWILTVFNLRSILQFRSARSRIVCAWNARHFYVK